MPPEVLTESEVQALLTACGEFSPVAMRNRAMIAVLYRSGLRISEALALEPKDVDLAAGQLALWFDSTNGAAKLMVKAKQANGTVVSGSITLA